MTCGNTVPSLTFALSVDYARATGGYVYDRRLVDELVRLGWQVKWLDLQSGFPWPTEADKRETAARLAALPDGAILLSDQLCFGVLPDVVAIEARRLQLGMIVHHPLADEGYGLPEVCEAFRSKEREALRHMAVVVTSSPATAATLLAEYEVAPSRLVIAPPGTDPAPLSAGSGETCVRLLGVGALVPRKGQDLLLAALGMCGDLDWSLTLAGNLSRTPDYVALVQRTIDAAGLTARVTLAGEITDEMLSREWQKADVFVSASRHEGYGMAAAEALARGVPIVATHAGVLGDWMPDGVAEIVPTGNVPALADALRRVIGDATYRKVLRYGALARRGELLSWSDTAARVDQRLRLISPAN